jgi:hypothetical protein
MTHPKPLSSLVILKDSMKATHLVIKQKVKKTTKTKQNKGRSKVGKKNNI